MIHPGSFDLPRTFQQLTWLLIALMMGLIAGSQSWLIAGAIILGLAGGILAVITPVAALTMMLILAPLRTLIATESAFQLPLDIGQITFTAFVGIWIIYRVLRKQPMIRLSWSDGYLALIVFLIATALTIIPAESTVAWLTEWIKWSTILISLILVRHLATSHTWEWLVAGIVLAGVANACIGIYIFLGGSGAPSLLINDRFFRAFGTFGQPNPFGGFMGLLLPVALMMMVGYGLRWRQQLSQQYQNMTGLLPLLPLMYYAVASLLIGLGLIVSWSRGAWLGFVVSMGVVIFSLPRQWWQRIIFSGLASLLLIGIWYSGLLPTSIVDRVTSSVQDYFAFDDVHGATVTDANYAVVERLAHWQAALNMAHDNPWLGVGLGNYEVVYDRYRLLAWEDPLGHAHNYYFNILAEGGIIGLSAYMIMWMVIVYITWQCQRHPDILRRLFSAGLLGTWAYLAIHSLLDNLYVNNIFLHMGALLGILIYIHSDFKTITVHRRIR